MIAQHPDCAKSSRLNLFLDAGFSHSAAMYFHVVGVYGIYDNAIDGLFNETADVHSEEGTHLLGYEGNLMHATDASMLDVLWSSFNEE